MVTHGTAKHRMVAARVCGVYLAGKLEVLYDIISDMGDPVQDLAEDKKIALELLTDLQQVAGHLRTVLPSALAKALLLLNPGLQEEMDGLKNQVE